jgi:hypothetical protein
MKYRVLFLVCALAACAAESELSVTRSALSVPSCGDVDLSGLDLTVVETADAFVISSDGLPLCAGTESEIDLALDRADEDPDDGTPLPSVTHGGEKDRDTLPGTPLPSATE